MKEQLRTAAVLLNMLIAPYKDSDWFKHCQDMPGPSVIGSKVASETLGTCEWKEFGSFWGFSTRGGAEF